MAQHDGKPYQPRRGPERALLSAEDQEAPADAVDHLTMVAAEAEAVNVNEEEHERKIEMEEDELEGEEDEEEMEDDTAEGDGQHKARRVRAGRHDGRPGRRRYCCCCGCGWSTDGPTRAVASATFQPTMTNQLTLSFQGDVYVFDSVSPDKVQVVVSLLGGRELLPGVGAGASSSTPYSKVETSDES